MDTTDWLIGASALATLGLAVAAFLSIRENRRIRESHYRRQGLDTVLNWAQTGVSILSEDISIQHRHNIELLKYPLVTIHAERNGILRSSEAFRQDFINAVFKAVTRLEHLFDIVKRITEGPPSPEPALGDKLLTSKKEAFDSFVAVVESANNLKVELRL